MTLPPRRCYTFGAFRFEVADLCLYRDGHPVPLTPKAAATLRVLIEHRGETVSKEHLLETVWADSFVGDSVLSVNVFALRKALATPGSDDDGGANDGGAIVERNTLGKAEFVNPVDARFRPCGLAVGPDGSLYVADSVKGRVWRIFYKG